MKVDDFQFDHDLRDVKERVGLEDPKVKSMKFDKVRKMNMGGVIKGRGGSFKGTLCK